MEEGNGIDHQSKVDLITAGAIGRLLPKLGEFLKQEHNLQTSMKEDIESLEIHLRRMEDALVVRMPRAQQDQVDPQEDKHCANELRELPYDTEDIVDNLMLRIDEGKQEVTQPIINQDSFGRETLDNIKVRVENLAAWHTANFVSTTTTSTVEPCLDDGFKQVRHLVDIHKIKAGLISRMSSSSQGLKIVSIFGAGGMGKTALAKAVYENIKRNFQCTAFVFLGPHPDMKKALRDILIHLDKQKYRDLNMSILDQLQLIDELRYFLEDMRFLIVIDDIWDIPSWEVIKLALVDNGCGSRIITTSHIFDVAESSGEVFKLMPLTIDGSKELFYAMLLCGRKGTITFDQAEQSTEYILEKCGGVPFAIVMIASLLASKPQEEWTEVYKSIGFGRQDDIVNIRKIIQFSYYDLPSHLKTCLLYLSIFPDGHVIEKDTLVWRWVAEGFVHEDQEHGESVFKVGERYLYELVSRSMIQNVENEETDMRGCRAESMVLDWIRTVAKEENFVNASGDWYDHDQHQFYHIMAVHNKVLEEPHDPEGMWKQKLRSFNGTGCSISSTRLMHRTFQALRVLSLESCELMDRSDGLENLIEGLLHLRYLGLRGTGVENLPIGIGGLRYLQTLDLTKTYISELPSSVTQLRQLKCLRCFAPRLKSPEGMGNLTSLEELRMGRVDKSPNFAKELSKLTELRVLHIVSRESFDGKWIEDLVESLSKLQNIEELELFCELRRYMTCRHVIAPGGFPKMRHLRTNTCWVMYQPGAMPCLKSVELQVDVQAFNDANFDVHHLYKLSYLRLLEKAHVGINCWGAKIEEAEEAEVALRHAVQSHPNRPRLILNRVGRCVDDKQISLLSGLHDSGVAPQFMPLELLRQITNDFSDEQALGRGTFGTVYKGVQNGKVVAVKLLHSMSQRLDYEEEFMKELVNLRRLNHPNIIRLLGYCYETKRVCIEYEGKYVLADKIYRALCFEYMPNASLRLHLSDEFQGLDWQIRYKIIKGTCEGLKYLHEGSKTPMYHLNLKPGDILLDENMVPKIADFGLSKPVCNNETQATSSFLGTIKYCPPEYIEQRYFSSKFDIFSLGVIMIEIIAGPQGYCRAAEMPSQEFIDHVQENWRNRLLQTIAGSTSLIYECHQVKRCIQIALACVIPDRKQRPSIGKIITWLNDIENIGVDLCVDDKQIRSLGGLHGSRLPHRAAGVASNHFEYEIGSQLPHRAAGATSNHFEYEIGSRLLHHATGAASNHFEYEIGSRLPPQAMPLELLRQITNNFSERLGRGTFGTVYKGVLNNGKEIAVKLLHSMPQRLEFEEEDFRKELENLRRLNHPNIIQLLGYCYEIEQECVKHKGRLVVADKITRALCFEYMHNTSLQGHFDDESLDWQTRYKIIMGTCKGLQYLHKGLENPMLHLDLKPGNILLDQNMVPKLADFGLSKLVYDSQTQTTKNFLGTRRYCPPEHFKGLLFSRKFDIFSLGVVMIEIIAGSKGYDKTAEMPSQEFIDHVQENWRKRIHRAKPGCTLPSCECREVKRCIEIALKCVHPERRQRPDIEDIISRLNETENLTEKSATTSSSQNET